jgi:hypothetical protein
MRMSNDEAKFLIDQFNKFASWRIAENQFLLSESLVLLSLSALGAAIWSLAFRATPPNLVTSIILPGALFACVIIICVLFYRNYYRAKEEHEADANRLLALEDHYSRFKSLPTLILARIVDPKFTPKDLEKFLEDNEPSPVGSPQT